MEDNILGRAGIQQLNRKQYLGRCQEPVFKLKNVATVTGSTDGAARAASCTMWAQLAARLKEWKQLKGKQITQGRLQQTSDLRKVFSRIGKQLMGDASNPVPLPPEHTSQSYHAWGYWLCRIDLWNVDNIDTGIKSAKQMYTREATVRSVERRNGFGKWVFDQTKEGIRNLHNITKRSRW